MNDDVTLPLNDGEQRDGLRHPRSDAAGSEVSNSWVPNSWGGFRLIARVGRGGFGEVYRAWDPSLEREVALKLLLAGGSAGTQSEDEYKSMLREARALASVRHSNIVSVYGIDRHEGRVGFWMDFVKGKTLSAVLGSQGPFGYREAALIGLDVTRALSAVHRAGLLHRDIKAENVMREEGGRILLMDLGLSSLQHDQTTSSGTPNYMAPEIWQGRSATVESDIYAMGVLLYFLVTGEHPVKLNGMTTKQAAEAITHRRPLMDLRADLPEAFLRAVSKAIETEPEKRFRSAGELSGALAECLGTGAPAEVNRAQTDAQKPALARWLVPVAAVALLLGAVAIYERIHEKAPPVAAGISSSDNEQYIKAQNLLKKSYKDANVAEAVTIFQQIVNEHSTNALAQAGLGSAYFTQYRNRNGEDKTLLDKAKAATDAALKLQADLAPALATRARIEAKTGDTDLAKRDAEAAKEANPRSPEAFAALAEANDAIGKKAEAIEALQAAIDLDPNNTMLLVRLGNYYLSDGRLDEAAREWRNASQIDPENVFALYDLGVLNIRLNRLDDAKSNFQQVLKAGEDADSYRALGTVFLYKGDYSRAIELQKKAVDLNPKDYQSIANLGGAYLCTGKNGDEAKDAYRRAIQLAEVQLREAPDDPELLVNLADYYATLKEAAKSAPLVRKALRLSPDDPKIVYFAGESYELLGDRSKAIPLIAKALAKGYPSTEFERDPEFAGIRNDPAFEAALKQAQDQNSADVAKQMH